MEFQSSSAIVSEGVGAFYDLVVVKQGESEVPILVSISTLNQGGSSEFPKNILVHLFKFIVSTVHSMHLLLKMRLTT